MHCVHRSVAITVLRKLLSILLLLAFAVPLATPLLAAMQDDDAHLPPCCRRHGKHRCSMGMMASSSSMQAMAAAMQNTEPEHPHFATPVEKCPYCPASVDAPQLPVATLPFFASLPAIPHSRDHIYAQPRALKLSLHTVSDSERGPPSFLLS